jgi:hypothetical protein
MHSSVVLGDEGFWKEGVGVTAALLAWTQRTHVSGDRSRVRYAYSMASCDFLPRS